MNLRAFRLVALRKSDNVVRLKNMGTKQSARKAQSNSSAFHILGDTLESAAETFEEATTNAHDSAKRAAEVTKSALSCALYKTCYGIAYGAVYSSVFLVEIMPEGGNLKRGFTEGAESAIEARKKAAERKAPKPRVKRSAKPKMRVAKPVKARADDFAETTAAAG
jgi:hypothetical protein